MYNILESLRGRRKARKEMRLEESFHLIRLFSLVDTGSQGQNSDMDVDYGTLEWQPWELANSGLARRSKLKVV